MIYRKVGKRVFDLIISVTALFMTGPIIAVAALVILLSSSGPVFFRQQRVGLRGEPFEILKLRTMTVNPDRQLLQTLNDDPEVLTAGRVLRRLKIDELPQLLNVLNGNMSIVGPRPCLEQTFLDMPLWARRRVDVRPGITGLSQVNGNIMLSWEERWRHDVYYVDRLSFLSDVSIIVKTILVVIFGEEGFRRTR